MEKRNKNFLQEKKKEKHDFLEEIYNRIMRKQKNTGKISCNT